MLENFPSDILGNIRRAFLGNIERDYPLGIVVFPMQHIVDDVLQVSVFFIRLAIGGPKSTEMVARDKPSRRISAQDSVLHPWYA